MIIRVYVRLGELDSRTNLCDDNRKLCSEPQDYEIESVVHHPSYDMPKYSNDIALIRLRHMTNSSMYKKYSIMRNVDCFECQLISILFFSFFRFFLQRFHQSTMFASRELWGGRPKFEPKSWHCCWMGCFKYRLVCILTPNRRILKRPINIKISLLRSAVNESDLKKKLKYSFYTFDYGCSFNANK